MKYSFCNDYSTLAHPNVLNALIKYNDEQNEGYGEDIHTLNARNIIKDRFSCHNSDIYFLNGGTQTNLVLISHALKTYQGVLSCETGHINVHETGAIEGSGHKIITEKGKNGKLYPEDVLSALKKNHGPHMVKIKLVYISNSTEIGTIYSKKELMDLSKVCRDNDLYLFVDGARLSSAIMSKDNDIDPSDFAKYTDAFYIGGTKIGLLNGEALVINNDELKKDFIYQIKNRGALNAKGFLLGIQFEEIFKDDLYFLLGKKENELAYYLFSELEKIGIRPYFPLQTNQVFIILDNKMIEELEKEFIFEVWEDLNLHEKVVRLVCSYSTKKEYIDLLVKKIKNIELCK
ncbi:MAG: aminotransferase class I/II-fold pyridoxal phosphate-dependent enzyme [Bacillales bacterium]|nr:aminotransferase class I/II-fold pyridoxal phosphate-dependent enzyme [Bacillales bacterium]